MNDEHDNAQTDREVLARYAHSESQSDDPDVTVIHIGMEAHDGYAPHSHEVRHDHLGVERELPHRARRTGAEIAAEQLAAGAERFPCDNLLPHGPHKSDNPFYYKGPTTYCPGVSDSDLGPASAIQPTDSNYLHDILVVLENIESLLERIVDKLEEDRQIARGQTTARPGSREASEAYRERRNKSRRI